MTRAGSTSGPAREKRRGRGGFAWEGGQGDGASEGLAVEVF